MTNYLGDDATFHALAASDLAAIATNNVLGNVSGGTAAPSAVPLGSTLLNTIPTTSGTTVSDTTSFTSAYSSYELILNYVRPAVGAKLLMVLSTNGGASYFNTAGNYSSQVQFYNTTPSGPTLAADTAEFPMSTGNNVSNNSAIGLCGVISVFLPSSASSQTTAQWRTSYVNSATGVYETVIGSGFLGASTSNAFRFLWSGGNSFAGGQIKVYGKP